MTQIINLVPQASRSVAIKAKMGVVGANKFFQIIEPVIRAQDASLAAELTGELQNAKAAAAQEPQRLAVIQNRISQGLAKAFPGFTPPSVSKKL